jgi:hypothetical protein
MFYRRKIILALLQTFGGKLEKINLQKLLFLLSVGQTEPEYEFVPYLFGCYSFSAVADLRRMVDKGLLSEVDSSYHKTDRKDYLGLLKEMDKRLVQQIFLRYDRLEADDLMRHTYINYPYYAINSTQKERLLNKEQLDAVQAKRPLGAACGLYTIGYEGVSLEAYLNKLLRHDVKLLIDVRNNPMSQKFGFAKSSLKKYCESLGIEYCHFPEVGIQSRLRKELKTQSDYDELFDQYRAETLSDTMATQQRILELVIEKERVAITCFEKNICQCHRKHLAEAVIKLPQWKYELKHI